MPLGVDVFHLVLEKRPVIFRIVIERDGQHVFFPVFRLRIRNIFPRHGIAHGLGPVHSPDDGIYLRPGISQGIYSSYQASHACTQDHVYGHTDGFKIFDYPYLRRSLGTAAAQHQGDRRPVAANTVHPAPDFLHGQGIFMRKRIWHCRHCRPGIRKRSCRNRGRNEKKHY